MPGGPLVIFIGIFVLVAVIGIVRARRRRQRALELQQFAASNGWTYVAEDDSQCNRWQRAPFNEGFDRRAKNVLFGRYRNHEMLAFDYTFKTRTQDSNGSSTQTHYYRVCAIALPTYLPLLEVSAENVLTRVAHVVGLQDIQFESEDFNRRYRVHGADQKFAYDVLSPRTIQSLMNLPVYQWRIDGTSIVSWATGSNNPVDLLGRLTALATVVDGVPQFVWHDHGVATAPPAPQPAVPAVPAVPARSTGSSAGPTP
jgi:hypothetical protein